MLYWDNQKSLLHFLPVPPSGHRLPECIFPMSSQPVSHKGGNRRVKKKKKEKNTHTHTERHMSIGATMSITKTRCYSLQADWESARGGEVGGVFSHRCGWHSVSVQKCEGILQQTSWSCDGKWCQGAESRVWWLHAHTIQCINHTLTYAFLAMHMVTVSSFILFSSRNINYGRFKLCTAWQTSGTPIVYLGPFSSWRLPDGLPWSEMETPHLVTSEISLGKLLQSKYCLKILVLTKYIQCVSVVLSSIILSQKTPFDFKKPLISCFSCIPSSQQTVNLTACLSNIKSEWSIAKHWSMKSKPLFYLGFFFSEGLNCR